MDSEIENIKDRISNFLMRESLEELPKFIDSKKDAQGGNEPYGKLSSNDQPAKEFEPSYFRTIIENLEREQKEKPAHM